MNYNNKRITGNDVIDNVADDEYRGYKTPAQLRNARTQVHKLKLDQTAKLPYLLLLKIDIPYMITMNIDIRDKVVNGEIGNLKYVEWKTTEEPENISTKIIRIWLEFQDKSVGQELHRKYATHIALNPDLQQHWVPIKLCKGTCTLESKIISCKCEQFPVTPFLCNNCTQRSR